MGKRSNYNKSRAGNRKMFTCKIQPTTAECMVDGIMKIADHRHSARNIVPNMMTSTIPYSAASFNFTKAPAAFTPINGVETVRKSEAKTIAEQAAEAARARTKAKEARNDDEHKKHVATIKKQQSKQLSKIKKDGWAKSINAVKNSCDIMEETYSEAIDKLENKVEKLEKRDSKRYMEKIGKKAAKAEKIKETEDEMKEVKRRLRKLDDESIERATRKAAKKKASPKSGPSILSRLRGTACN